MIRRRKAPAEQVPALEMSSLIDLLNALASDRVGIERVTIEGFARR